MRSHSAMSDLSVLLVASDHKVISEFRELAARAETDLMVAESPASATSEMVSHPFDVLFVQVDGNGWEVRRCLADSLALTRTPPVVAFGTIGSISDAVQAVRAGACDYLAGPPKDPEAFRRLVRGAAEHITHEGQGQATPSLSCTPFKGFVTRDYRLLSVCSTVAAIANSRVILLIEGEKGTGKSLLARKLHESSFRCLGPFVEVDCSKSCDSSLICRLLGELRRLSPLPGEPGADIEPACGPGTLLLNEVTSAPARLWEAIGRCVRAQHMARSERADLTQGRARLVLASTTPLQADQLRLLQGGEGKGPGLVRVRLPALCERIADVPLLADHFLKGFCRQHDLKVRGFSDQALSVLVHYAWPGNVGELREAVEHGMLNARSGQILPESLPAHLKSIVQPRSEPKCDVPCVSLKEALREPERRYILKALRETHWNKRLAARRLRISRSTLYKKFRQHKLTSAAESEGGVLLEQPRWVTVVDSDTARGIH